MFRDKLITQNQNIRLRALDNRCKTSNISRVIASSWYLNLSCSLCVCIAGALAVSDNSSLAPTALGVSGGSLAASAVLAYSHSKLVDDAISKTYEIPEVQQV